MQKIPIPPQEIISGWPPKSFSFTGEWDRQRKYQSNRYIADRNKKDIWLPVYRSADGEVFVSALHSTEVCPTPARADVGAA
jgi:hypothetical protein